MASYERCLLIFLLITSLFTQIYAREAKFFSKVTKTTKEVVTPVSSPAPAPALQAEPELVEHGYGLYGRDPYENTPKNTVKGTGGPVFKEKKYVPTAELSQDNNGESEYKFTPTMENPTKTPIVDEEKFVDTNEFNNNKNNKNEYVSEKQGMSDTRFLENGKYYYDTNQLDGKNANNNKNYEGSLENEEKNENEKDFASERQGMSDTRFMENGKYYYDVNQHGNKGVNNNYVRNEGNDEGYVPQKQGMSDTQYMENKGKYFYDIQNDQEGNFKGKNDVLFDANNNDNEQFQEESHGMSDTHYLNNGKYFYDVNNEIVSQNNMYNNMNNKGYVNDNQGYNSNFEGSNSKNYPNNEYVTQGKRGNFGYPKKFPNEYDTMEEYDREQGYVDPKDVYVP